MLTIWDCSADPSGQAGTVYRWDGYSEKNSVYSLLRYVENHGDRLRRKYLAWIHHLGESQIHGRRLIDHLAFEDGLSFWWMTLFVEKSLYSSPITDAIRLLALEEIVVQRSPGKIKLVSASRWLHETMRSLCHCLGIDYEWQQLPFEPQPLTRERLYRSLPLLLQALLSLARHLRVHWPFRRAEKSSWFKGDRAIFICGYFINVVSEEAATGHFHSRYWEGLHGLLQEVGIKGNWLHHNAAPTSGIALEWVQCFNRDRLNQGFHTFLDAYLSWPVVFRVFKRWFWLNLAAWRLRGVERAFCVPGTNLSLWPLMQGHWDTSLRGSVAIDNIFSIELFDAALCDLPQQKKGLYLFENHGWERALIHAWRKHGHGQLIAVAHSTVRFWDLRYFTDPRTLQSTDLHKIPLPDLTALNGKVALDAYRSADYPEEAIVECEALRYGYLSDFRDWSNRTKTPVESVRVLILGDLLRSSTMKMLQLIEAAAPRMDDRFTYTVKPHPVCPVNSGDFPGLSLALVTNPLGKLLQDFDIAYGSNITSAVVDAYLAGLPVVVMLDNTELNFSPLRGQAGVQFVSAPEELAGALQTPELWAATNPDRDKFFFLDRDLRRWRQLLLSPVSASAVNV